MRLLFGILAVASALVACDSEGPDFPEPGEIPEGVATLRVSVEVLSPAPVRDTLVVRVMAAPGSGSVRLEGFSLGRQGPYSNPVDGTVTREPSGSLLVRSVVSEMGGEVSIRVTATADTVLVNEDETESFAVTQTAEVQETVSVSRVVTYRTDYRGTNVRRASDLLEGPDGRVWAWDAEYRPSWWADTGSAFEIATSTLARPLVRDPDGTLWGTVATTTSDSFVLRFNLRSRTEVGTRVRTQFPVRHGAVDASGTFWGLGYEGLLTVRSGVSEVVPHDSQYRTPTGLGALNDIAIEGAFHLLATGSAGVWANYGSGWTSLNRGLSDLAATEFTRGPDGALWVATAGDACNYFVYGETTWVRRASSPRDGNGRCPAFAPAPDGTVWLADSQSNVRRLTDGRVDRTYRVYSSGDRVLVVGRTVWVAGDGVSQIDNY